MKIKNLFKKYYPLVMLLIFVSTVFWGLATTVIKSPAIASTLLHPDTLKIVQITDVHYATCTPNKGGRMLASSDALLNDAVSQVNQIKDVDVVVFSGDSINEPKKNDLIAFAKVANKLKYPWYNALGNHEVCIQKELTKDKYFKILETLNLNYSSLTIHDMMLKPYYVIMPKKDYAVIFLDGVIDSAPTANGEFTDKQLCWLDEKLTHYKDKKVIIVQHFPVIEPLKTKGHHSLDHSVLDAPKYLEVLDHHHNVVAILAGHYHCSKVVKRNNVLHITTPSLVQYPNAFRVITISDEKTRVKVQIKIIDTRLADIKEQSRVATGAVSKTTSGNAESIFYLEK